ncbi:MAG: hypothetical protein GX775_05550 [Erysipelothrix sp.]|nr:hypothetical protein [Erysipelothrix sp.]
MKSIQNKFTEAMALRDHTLQGIGRLQEKSIHSTLKYFLSENEQNHEVPIHGFVADVVVDQTIYEIQTGSFDKLRAKIMSYTPDYELHIVFPIAYQKHVLWFDEEHRLIKRNKSPKKGSIYDIVRELYKIRPLITNERLFIDCFLINMEEIRLLDGWDLSKKRGATKVDKVPMELVEIVSFHEPSDYLRFLPENLPTQFLAKDLSDVVRLTPRQVSALLLVLRELGLIRLVGKQGRANLYEVV